MDRRDVSVVSHSQGGLSVIRMVMAPNATFSYVSDTSVATVLQGSGQVLDLDSDTSSILTPGQTYLIDKGTSVEFRNTMPMEMIVSFVNQQT